MKSKNNSKGEKYHEQRSDQRPNLIEKRERLKDRDFRCRAKLDQGAARVQRHDDTEGETGSDDERKRADARLAFD